MACAKCNARKKRFAGQYSAPQYPVFVVSIDGSGDKVTVIVQQTFEIQTVRMQKVLPSGSHVQLYPNEVSRLIELNAPIVQV